MTNRRLTNDDEPALPPELDARLRALPDTRYWPVVAMVEAAVATAERRQKHKPRPRRKLDQPPTWFSGRDLLQDTLVASGFGTHDHTAQPLDRATGPFDDE